MTQKVKKVRINQEQKFEIIKICLDYVYKTQKWKELLEEYEVKQNTFKEIVKSFYKEFFDITDEIDKFSKKNGLKGNHHLRLTGKCFTALKLSNYLNSTSYRNFSIEKCLRYENSFFDNNIELPFYGSLDWRDLNSFNKPLKDKGNCYNMEDYINKMFTEYMDSMLKKFEDRKDKSLDILGDMIKILNSCIYQNEVKELLPIPEVINYIDTLDTKKISTALCTLDVEKVDFIKKYIESQK